MRCPCETIRSLFVTARLSDTQSKTWQNYKETWLSPSLQEDFEAAAAAVKHVSENKRSREPETAGVIEFLITQLMGLILEACLYYIVTTHPLQ